MQASFNRICAIILYFLIGFYKIGKFEFFSSYPSQNKLATYDNLSLQVLQDLKKLLVKVWGAAQHIC